MDFEIVDARPDHVPFLAWVVQAATKSHLEKSIWDLFVDGPEDEVLRFLEALLDTKARHWGKVDRFIVAEAGGQPAAALCGYFMDDVDGQIMVQGAREAALKLGWSEERIAAGWQRSVSVGLLSVKRAPGAWIVESVATQPQFRRMGLTDLLIAEILDRGRQRKATEAEISVFIGNDAAQRAYEKAGFTVVDEARHPLFESVYKCAGVRLLRRPL